MPPDSTPPSTLGLADNTIVVLWGDHGWRLNDYGTIGKHTVLERALEAPLIIRPPACLQLEAFAGIPAQGVVESIDIYPTHAELCGLAPPSSVVGSSLVPMLRNPFAPGKNHAFARFNSMTTIRTPGWRLIDTNGDKDLYQLSAFRYEVADVSASNPSALSTLSANLSSQGARPGTTYSAWTDGSPQLADPDGDADEDGSSNLLEYGSGTDPLAPASRPAAILTTEDLTGKGFSDRELVYSVVVSSLPNDITVTPSTCTNLQNWSFAPLTFLDAADLGGNRSLVRYRLASPKEPVRFFRAGTQSPPSDP